MPKIIFLVTLLILIHKYANEWEANGGGLPESFCLCDPMPWKHWKILGCWNKVIFHSQIITTNNNCRTRSFLSFSKNNNDFPKSRISYLQLTTNHLRIFYPIYHFSFWDCYIPERSENVTGHEIKNLLWRAYMPCAMCMVCGAYKKKNHCVSPISILVFVRCIANQISLFVLFFLVVLYLGCNFFWSLATLSASFRKSVEIFIHLQHLAGTFIHSDLYLSLLYNWAVEC